MTAMMSKRLFSSAIALSLFLGGLFAFAGAMFPNEAFAQTCQCVCNTPGGVQPGAVTTTDQAASVCQADCSGRFSGGSYQTCTTDTTVFDQGNAKCWEQEECIERTVNVNGVDKPSIWQSQQPSDCPAGLHYCYNPPIPVDLNVAVSTLADPNQAANLGEYIKAFYDLLLPASALIATVILMIGGMQYILARGKQEQISKAKDRITKAVTGLVLILGAYTIVYLVDPRLTSFDALRVPVLKGAIFLDEGTTCQTLEDMEIEIQYIRDTTDDHENGIGNSKGCGAICEITEIPEGSVFAGDVGVGDKFFSSNCSQNDATCLISGTGEPEDKTGQCARCWDFYPSNEFNIPPSTSVCGKVDPEDKLRQTDGSFAGYGKCFFSADADVVPGSVADVQSYLTGGTCAIVGFDCNVIRSQGCDAYGEQAVLTGPPPDPDDSGLFGNFVTGFKYLTGQLGDTGTIGDLESGGLTYQSICSADPCHAPETMCQWNAAEEECEAIPVTGVEEVDVTTPQFAE